MDGKLIDMPLSPPVEKWLGSINIDNDHGVRLLGASLLRSGPGPHLTAIPPQALAKAVS